MGLATLFAIINSEKRRKYENGKTMDIHAVGRGHAPVLHRDSGLRR